MADSVVTLTNRVIKYPAVMDSLFPISVSAPVPFVGPLLQPMPYAPNFIPDTPVITDIGSITTNVISTGTGANQQLPGSIKYQFSTPAAYLPPLASPPPDIHWGSLPYRQVKLTRRDVNSGPIPPDSIIETILLPVQMDNVVLNPGQNPRILKTRRQPIPNQDAVLSVASPCVWTDLTSTIEVWTPLNTNPC